jgi:hypothetical protein
MSQDNYFAMIASRAIDKGYDDEDFSFNKNGWVVETLDRTEFTISIKIKKNNNTTYMLCHEGTQTTDHLMTDSNAMNNNKRKKVDNMKGQILKEIWSEFNKYRSIYQHFYNSYNNDGDIMFSGHSLGGAVAGVAAAVFNVKSILIAPIPFIVHKNWLKNYTHNPKTYVNKEDRCVGDSGKAGQINWSITKHYSVNYINNGHWSSCHSIASFVTYFRAKTNNLC